MVICLERAADLHTAQLMPLPLTVSCFSKIQIGFTFLVPADLGSPGKRAVKRVCVCVCVCVPWMTSFSKQSLLFRMTRSKHLSVLVLTFANKLFLMPAFSRTQSFVFLAVHGALSN